jgi:hypothetical protein
MTLGYIDLKGISHLDLQARGGGVYDDKMWRESYYYVMSDPNSGIVLITTMGFRPNKPRSEGFVLVLKDGKPVHFDLLVAFGRPVQDRYDLRLKGLEYAVEGAGWRLRYRSKRCTVDVLFTPVNKIFQYITDDMPGAFERIGSQHYEQTGSYEGRIVLDGETYSVGPCFGHRDHSWGIRDWSSVNRYRLFCCGFSNELAFNLWEAKVDGKDFMRGYVFDGTRNSAVVQSRVRTIFQDDGRTPVSATIELEDDEGRKYEIECRVLGCVQFPPKECILYETVAEMRCNGKVSWGLLEYLFHETRAVPRLRAYMKALAML